jgi:two-component system, NtrC family, nitrogen regulation response regulator NtrX
MPAVLVADDEANIRRMLARLLEGEGYEVREAADGRAALQAVEAEEPDVALIDLAMPELDGMDTLRELTRRWPALPVVMMSGRATLADAVQATKVGAFHFIEKPLTPEAVLLSVHGAVELRRARDLSRALAAELTPGDRLVGSSSAIARVRELVAQVAPTDARVLLTGESGTGKELVAAELHTHSRRANGPFVRVNSAAIPHTLVESELFGHEKGAFTGAAERRRGRFELAHGGTLFLDEVGDLGADAQAKLLRTLETGELQRVGGGTTLHVDVRVVAATNKDLRQEIAAGRFRDDLYYRLNVVPIHLPPLRERLGDVPELVQHVFARLTARHGLVPPRVAKDAMSRLQRHEWPGNVRELANICERLAILYPGRTIGLGEVAAVLPGGIAAEHSADGSASEGGLVDRIDEFERNTIIRALDDARGSISEAARILRTDRPNLYRRMKRLGIDR